MFLVLLAARAYLTLNSNSSTCVQEDPCEIDEAIRKNDNYKEFYFVDMLEIKGKTLQPFLNIVDRCANKGISLFGQNQTINFMNSKFGIALNFSSNLMLQNFTFINCVSGLIKSNGSQITLKFITFSHSRSEVISIHNSSFVCENCKFISNYIDFNNNLIIINNSDSVRFLDTYFDSTSQFPISEKSIFRINNSKISFDKVNVLSNYHNFAFIQLMSSEMLFTNSFFHKNCGGFLFYCSSNSNCQFSNIEFIGNSCGIFNTSQSKLSASNISIQHNCIFFPICQFLNNSKINIEKSHFVSNSCGATLKTHESQMNLSNCFFTSNVSPSDLILINLSRITIESSEWRNTTTVFGSAISVYQSTIVISDSNYISSYSRICGSSIRTQSSKIDCQNLSFFDSQSLTYGASLCLISCIDPFKLDNMVFNKSKAEGEKSIYVDQCIGIIMDSVFSGEIQDEISVPLFNKCINCSFLTQPEMDFSEEDANSSKYLIVPIFFVIIFLFLVSIRRKIIKCLYRFRPKRRYRTVF